MALQESLNEFYEKIEDGYYSACDYIETQLKVPIYEAFINPIEDRGIPSFPVVIFLFLLIIGGAAFLLLNNPSASLKVIVVSDGANVDGASVVLTSGTYSRTIETKDGAAQFNNLPKGKDAKITVSKQGFGDEERSFKIGSAASLKIILSAGGSGFEVAVVDFSNVPLAGARVSYSYGEFSDSATTDSGGIALLSTPAGTDLTIQVSLQGYETSPKITYLPEKGTAKKVILRKIEASPTPPPSDNSQLEISVKDDADGSAIDADLLIFDALSGDLLKTASTTYGMYDTDDYKVGAKLRVKASSDGYEPAVKEKTLVAGKTTLPIRLKKSTSTANASIAIIKVVDGNNAPLISEIRLWEGLSEANFTLLKIERAASELRSEAFDNRIYFATAFKEGYLPGRTMKFIGGSTKTIQLIKADANNSLNLTVNVANEDGVKIRDATIAFFDSDDYQVPPYEQKTNAQGKAVFRNFPKAEFRIVAVKSPNSGEITETLSDSPTELNITLFAPTGTIEFIASDREQNTTAITQFDAFLYYKNERNNSLYKSCSASAGSCAIDARTDKEFNYVVYSKNYQNATGTVKANPNNSTRIPALLYRLDSKIISEIVLDGITDMNDGEVTELTTDQSYLLKINLYSKQSSERNGMFLSLEGSDGAEIAYFTNYSHAGYRPNGIRGSTSLSDLETCRTDYASLTGAYDAASWLDTTYDFRGSSLLVLKFRITTRIASDKLVVKYRSYSVSSGEFIRDPADSKLGYSEGNSTNWCSAATYNRSFVLNACGNFGEACCVSRIEAGAIDSCNQGWQCQKSETNPIGFCTYPTNCGATNYQCSDNSVCCLNSGTGIKACTLSCDPADVRECSPACSPPDEKYCDSSSNVGNGICKDAKGSICGKENEICCSGLANECNAGLACSSSNRCIPCGGINQQCCDYSDANTAMACLPDLQCVISGGSQICKTAEVCGSSSPALRCTGATVCCNDAASRGQCLPYSQCTADVICPSCRFDQYCDAGNLGSSGSNGFPVCRDCASNLQLCQFGGRGELCSLTLPGKLCIGGVCEIQPASAFGICRACGTEGSSCCDSYPKCSGDNVCSLTDNKCVYGNKLCDQNNEACVKVEFSQYQCRKGYSGPPTTLFCTTNVSGSGFTAHSLKPCENCTEGKLQIKFTITDNMYRFTPGTLTITISDVNALQPQALQVGSRLTNLDPTSATITAAINSASDLTPILTVIPYEPNGNVLVTLNYTHNSSMKPIVLQPYVMVRYNTIPTAPTDLQNMFACNKLVLRRANYEGIPDPVVETSCTDITFQVDSIFPYDAIPLNDSALYGQYGANLGYRFGDDADINKYNNCFDYGTEPGGSALRYWPTRYGCPLAPVGNSVPGGKIAMRIYLASDTGTPKKIINITIVNFTLSSGITAYDFAVTPYKDALIKPKSYYGQDADDPNLKLVYALNNRFVPGMEEQLSQPKVTAGTYSYQNGVYKRNAGYANLLGGDKTGDLLAWNNTGSPELEFYPDASSFPNAPSPLAVISSSAPSPNSLAQKLISEAEQELDLGYSQEEKNACIEGCEINSVENYSACIADFKINGHTIPELMANCTRGCDGILADQTDECVNGSIQHACESICSSWGGGPSDYCSTNCRRSADSCVGMANTIWGRCISQDGCTSKNNSWWMQAYANCGMSSGEVERSCKKGCTAKFSEDYDRLFSKALISAFMDKTIQVARATAFKRSFANTLFCLKQNPSPEETLDPAICRSSEKDWMKITKKVNTLDVACMFCYDTYGLEYGEPTTTDQSRIDVCDIRCQPEDPEDAGICGASDAIDYCAVIGSGENYTDISGNVVDCPEGDNSCVQLCSGRSANPGDYCDPGLCTGCMPDGTRTTEEIAGFESEWQNQSAIYAVEITPTGTESLSEPYRYFVSDPETTSFKFSTVMPLSANIVFNKMTNPADFNLVSGNAIDGINSLPDRCKVRLGNYLLSMETTNGVDFEIAGTQRQVEISPLYVSENYPNIVGAGQDYCGNQLACNLFNPVPVAASRGTVIREDVFPASKYPDSCLAWEWPITPDGFTKQYAGVKKEYPYGNKFYQYPYSQGGENVLLNSVWTLFRSQSKPRAYLGGVVVEIISRTSSTYACYAPYDIAKYPDVFAYKTGSACKP